MTFAYYAGLEAVKGLQKFHNKAEKLTKNALKKLDGILLPEFYKKVAEVMQEEKTTLKSLQNSFDDIILDQWVSMQLRASQNQGIRKHTWHTVERIVKRTAKINGAKIDGTNT